MDPEIRRVVTTHDGTGQAVVLFDGPTPHKSERAGIGRLQLPADHLARQMGEGHAAGKARPPRHHAMHRTRSIDYAIVLSGEIDMLLDESEIHLKAGDVLVQQATNHAWVNRGSAPCRIAFVL